METNPECEHGENSRKLSETKCNRGESTLLNYCPFRRAAEKETFSFFGSSTNKTESGLHSVNSRALRRVQEEQSQVSEEQRRAYASY